jgi:hypothetical protein
VPSPTSIAAVLGLLVGSSSACHDNSCSWNCWICLSDQFGARPSQTGSRASYDCTQRTPCSGEQQRIRRCFRAVCNCAASSSFWEALDVVAVVLKRLSRRSSHRAIGSSTPVPRCVLCHLVFEPINLFLQLQPFALIAVSKALSQRRLAVLLHASIRLCVHGSKTISPYELTTLSASSRCDELP